MKYTIYTDGSSLGNPGYGGWAYIIENAKGDRAGLGSGGERNTTNNRMELTAVLEALRKNPWLSNVECLTVVTDSRYVCDTMAIDPRLNQTRLAIWKDAGWKTTSGSPVKNQDLWEELEELVSATNEIHFKWVRGHAGHLQNERCDEMARSFANELRFEDEQANANDPTNIQETELDKDTNIILLAAEIADIQKEISEKTNLLNEKIARLQKMLS